MRLRMEILKRDIKGYDVLGRRFVDVFKGRGLRVSSTEEFEVKIRQGEREYYVNCVKGPFCYGFEKLFSVSRTKKSGIYEFSLGPKGFYEDI